MAKLRVQVGKYQYTFIGSDEQVEKERISEMKRLRAFGISSYCMDVSYDKEQVITLSSILISSN